MYEYHWIAKFEISDNDHNFILSIHAQFLDESLDNFETLQVWPKIWLLDIYEMIV